MSGLTPSSQPAGEIEPPAPPASRPSTPVRRCPRCGYRGDGVPYFGRVGHVGLLVGVSLITYGLGGLLYWGIKRNDTICPSCGLSWKGRGIPLGDGGPDRGPPKGGMAVTTLPPGGGLRRVAGVGLVLVSLMLVAVGLAEWEVAAMAVGGVLGASGALTFGWGWKALQGRREALLQQLQQQVLQLAHHSGGRLTVSSVATHLGIGLPAAERVLISMDDGFRVRSEITEEGVLLYEFPELRVRSLPSASGEPGESLPG